MHVNKIRHLPPNQTERIFNKRRTKTTDEILMGNSIGRKIFDICNIIVLISMALLAVLPVWHIVMKSLSSPVAVEAGLVGLWPVDFDLFSYNYILRQEAFYRAFFISVKRVLIAVPFSLLCTVFVAYPLSKSENKFPARKIYVWLFLITMLFNGGLIPTYMVVKYTGIINTIWSLVLPASVNTFNMLILMNFFRELPKEIEESALIDGAGHWSILFRLYMPLAKPALATIILFLFVSHWNSWFDGLIYINNRVDYPLQTYLQSILTVPDTKDLTVSQLQELGKISRSATNAAQIVITSAPILMIYPFLQKYYTKGITLGSVKS